MILKVLKHSPHHLKNTKKCFNGKRYFLFTLKILFLNQWLNLQESNYVSLVERVQKIINDLEYVPIYVSKKLYHADETI